MKVVLMNLYFYQRAGLLGPVSVNVRMAVLDLPSGRTENRKIEVVADGLQLFHGAQVAVDATLWCARRQRADHD